MSNDFDTAVEALYRAASEPDLWPDALAAVGRHAGAADAALVNGGERPTPGDMLLLALPSPAPGRPAAAIALFSGSDLPIDAAVARERIERLSSHIVRAIGLSREISRARQLTGEAEAMKDMLPTPVFWLDRLGRVADLNAHGRGLLDAGDGLVRDGGGRLAARLPGESARLQAAIRAAIGDRSRAQHAISIERPGEQPPLLLLLMPLESDPRDARPSLLVQVANMAVSTAGKENILRSAYQLTVSEARVAVLAASGNSAPDAAAALGVSANTVRTHLARVFDKTGARSQRALAQLLAAITPFDPHPAARPNGEHPGFHRAAAMRDHAASHAIG